MAITFVLGGARSGKSSFAERYAAKVSKGSGGFEDEPLPVVYLATAQALDEEMNTRISVHQAQRPQQWTTIEEPLNLPNVLRELTLWPVPPLILIDCLSLLLSNWMFAGYEVETEIKTFVAALQEYPAPVVVVSNEVGHGIVPADALTRKYRDLLGWFNQAVAAKAKTVLFVVAGIPLDLRRLEAEW